MYGLSAYAAGEAYLALGGQVGHPGSSSFPGIIGPFAVAAVVHVSINHGLLWGMLMLVPRAEPGSPPGRWSGTCPMLFLSDLGYATLGLLIAALWSVGGAFAAILVLVPLFVARWAIGQFAAQERAYAATMAALCQAVETKDCYTSGHSERVSRGSAMIAREVGMRGPPRGGDPVRGHAPRCGQARRAHDGAAEERRAVRGGVRRDPVAPDARAGDRPGDRLPRRGAGRHHAPPRADGRPAAIRWDSPATRSPSSRGSSRSPTPSTR